MVSLPLIREADMDGDGVPEVAVIYSRERELYLLIMKWQVSAWHVVLHQKGPGYAVSAFAAAPVVSPYRHNLIVGWQIGAEWSKLSVYDWSVNGLRDLAPEELFFSRLEVGHFPSSGPREDGKVELALWMHDTGEAYRVEVVRWQDQQFVPAIDVYPYYFRNEALLELHERIEGSFDSASRAEVTAPLNVARYPAAQKAVGGTRWGYIDDKGAWRIEPQYELAASFQPMGLAVVQAGGKSGVIDREGRFVVQPAYEWINDFAEGRATVIDSEGFRVIDESGTVLTSKAYSFISGYSNGRALFSQTVGDTNLYGYLDLHGREVIPAQYLDGGDFADGKAIVKTKEQEYALIGLNGEKLAVYPYDYVGALGDGLMPFRKEPEGKYGYIDEQGRTVIEPRFTWAMPFQEGRAVVNMAEDYQSRYGLIDRSGMFVIEAKYNDIRPLREGRVALGQAINPEEPFIGSKYAVSDLDGRLLTGFDFYEITEYHNGLASVSDRTHTYFIDRSGKPADNLPRFTGNGTVTLLNKLIAANIDQRLSYYDRSGALVKTPNTVIPLSSIYRVREHKYNPNRDYLVYYPQVEGLTDPAVQASVNRQLRQLSQVKEVPSGQLPSSYTGDFSVPFFRNRLLQLELNAYDYPFGAAHGMPTLAYVHLDLTNGRFYQLQDLFKPGSDYVKVLSNIVGKQIVTDPAYDYVFPDSYKGIQSDQPFYITDDALHLYFQPYEIGPYAAGFPDFRIPYFEIMEIINTNGEFWKSFH